MKPQAAPPALLTVEDLRVAFPVDEVLAEAVRGVDFRIAPGEALGLVGESGSGKSLSAMALMQLVAAPGRITGGRALFDGVDLIALDEKAMRRRRGRDISMVFQDPSTSLNPAFTIGQQLVDTIRTHRPDLGRHAARERAAEVLALVGIASPAQRLDHYPHEFSGGMRQRVLIAMAVACEPRLLIADEPTTALDVTVQARIVDLLNDLRERLGLAILFVSHNLDLVAEVCDRVCVMYAGRIVETGPVRALFTVPLHPYTRLLQRCVPRLDDRDDVLESIVGSPPRFGETPPGCAFASRCPQAHDRCRAEDPITRRTGTQEVACWAIP
ncbi:MAG: Peptide transporter ATP-binding protein [Bradyrhizobium sp.]|nr:Peptide transporter ATP-binding protein [Bradyrhizobium sp.]